MWIDHGNCPTSSQITNERLFLKQERITIKTIVIGLLISLFLRYLYTISMVFVPSINVDSKKRCAHPILQLLISVIKHKIKSNKNAASISTFIDLSRVFDTANHSVFNEKLYLSGIRGTLYYVIQHISYTSSKTTRVSHFILVV